MPWKVVKDTNACPVNKPWAVKNVQTGSVNGRCHETKAKAQDQAKAMYASQKGKKVVMDDYPQIIKAITGTPWLILPESLSMIMDIVNTRLSGEGFTDEEISARLAAAENQNGGNPRTEVGGGVGIISLNGPIFPKANLMTRLSGATSLDVFSSDLKELLADDSVKQIVMDINSPGGSSELVHETGTLIREAREQKPIYAMANTLAASAGLWLLSQATEAYATPSGKVGSLGVYTAHEDISAQDAQQGRKITIVSSGDYKTALSPHEPLTDAAKEYMQEGVDELKQTFIEEVAAGRNLDPQYVEDTFGNAKVFSAKKAAEIKMVDGVQSMDSLIGKLVQDNASSQTTALTQHVTRVHSLFGKEGRALIGDIVTEPVLRVDDDDNSGGDLALKPEQLTELKTALGVEDDDEFVEKAKKVFGEHAELSKNLSVADTQRTFAEQFPEEYARTQRLLEKDRANEARAFVESVSTFKTQVGDQKQLTEMGLSALAINTISESHAKFASGTGTLEDFEAAITAITDSGTVKFGENGSSRHKDLPAIDTGTKTGLATARQAFATKVSEVQAQYSKDNPGQPLDYMQAVKIAAEQNPELAQAYQLSATN